MKRKYFILFLMLLCSLFTFSQNKNEDTNNTTKVWRINFLNPSVEIELPVNSNSTFSASVGVGYTGAYPDLTYGGDGFTYIIAPFLDTQYKWFYNFNKRKSKNLAVKNNSGNFISFRGVAYGPSIAENIHRTSNYNFAFGPTWGIQRSYGKNFHFLFDVGPQYYFDTEGNGNFWPLMVQLNLGFDL